MLVQAGYIFNTDKKDLYIICKLTPKMMDFKLCFLDLNIFCSGGERLCLHFRTWGQ